MKLCVKLCLENNKVCDKSECRDWINYKEDLNCTNIAIKKNGCMTFHEIAKRLEVSYARIAQIEKDTIRKLQKEVFNKKLTNY